MSRTVSHDRKAGQPAAGQQAEALAAVEAGVARRRRRGGWTGAIVAVVLAGTAAGWRAGVLSPGALSGNGQSRAAPPATQAVTRRDLSAVVPVSATLGYAGSYTVTGQGSGTLTALPRDGQVISQGQVLYTTDLTSPVVLLYGTVPDWRALDEGVTGADVSQLNHDLVALGDADSTAVSAAGWDYFSRATKAGVQKLQSSAGVPAPTGRLPLGQVVFEPGALRVSRVTGNLGGASSGPVLQATSDQHVVTVPLNVSDQAEVRAGDAVTVTLPDGRTTAGVVSSVGTVATTSGSAASGSTTTIPVTVTLSDPGAVGNLDQAPVTVNITTSSARDVLAVPVDALLAQASGGYVVEVALPGNTRRYVPVHVGPVFDDADGLVQVAGALIPGQRVVVPAT